MPQVRNFPMPWATICTTSTSNEFHPVTGWMAAGPLSALRCNFEIAAINGNMTLSPGFQVANTPNTPGSVTALLAAFDSTVDVFYPADWTDVLTTLEDQQLIRFGWVVKNSSGSLISSVRVSGRMSARVS